MFWSFERVFNLQFRNCVSKLHQWDIFTWRKLPFVLISNERMYFLFKCFCLPFMLK